MSKASKRRKSGGRKRGLDQARYPNGRVSHAAGERRMQEFVETARDRKALISGRVDLPDDVLGILFGHKKITDAEYNIGRKFEALAARLYGRATGAGGAMFKESITPPNAEDAERNLEPMTDEEATRMFMDMDRTLRNCGLKVHNVTAAAIRYSRYPQTEEQLDWVVKGLERLAEGRVPESDARAIMGDREEEEGAAAGGPRRVERVHYQRGDETVAHLNRDGEDIQIVEMKRVVRARLTRYG